jgi:curli production assembly/transport component CsgG
MQKEFDTIPPPAGKPVVVAVYSFLDKTGQRRPAATIANLSTAVTQGADAFLIKALGDVGRGTWFTVVERVGIDSLTKERQLIRQMREAYDGANAKPLSPMMFAGIIIEGGITGYDSSTKSGGYAARILGIGPQTQYSEDIVTVSLRVISVNTGKVLASVNVQKTIYSSSDSLAVLKFIKDGTQAFELEAGLTINEPGTQAVKAAVEAAVVELIKEGEKKGIWDFKVDVSERPVEVTSPQPVVVVSNPGEPPVETKPVEVPIVNEKKTTENIKKKEVKVEEVNKGPKKPKERVNVQLH